jgi:hypothetical protein
MCVAPETLVDGPHLDDGAAFTEARDIIELRGDRSC